MNDFLKNVIKEVGNEYASLAIDGVEAGDVESFIDTGSYIFNALLSGSLHGGLPSNKITALAGESATGKTYFAMGIVKTFLDANPKGSVMYFESEKNFHNNSKSFKKFLPINKSFFPISSFITSLPSAIPYDAAPT